MYNRYTSVTSVKSVFNFRYKKLQNLKAGKIPLHQPRISTGVPDEDIIVNTVGELKDKLKEIKDMPAVKRKRSGDDNKTTGRSKRAKKAKDEGLETLPTMSTGPWKDFEMEALKKGIEVFGRDWIRIALDIPTRIYSSVKSQPLT